MATRMSSLRDAGSVSPGASGPSDDRPRAMEPLAHAARRADSDEVRRLLAAGGDPNVYDPEIGTPLIAAIAPDSCIREWYEFGRIQGLPPLPDNWPPYLSADGNAAPLTSTTRMPTPRVEVIKLLLDHGADPNRFFIRRDRYYSGPSRAHKFWSIAPHAPGAAPGRPAFLGLTPLAAAARSGDPWLVSLLVESGADPNVVVARHALTEACSLPLGDASVTVEYLLSLGADPNGNGHGPRADLGNIPVPFSEVSSDGFTPLMGAVRWSKAGTHLTAMLIRAGANVNAVDRNGMSAIHYYAMNWQGPEAVLHHLIRAGANPSTLTQDGSSVCDLMLESMLEDGDPAWRIRSDYSDVPNYNPYQQDDDEYWELERAAARYFRWQKLLGAS